MVYRFVLLFILLNGLSGESSAQDKKLPQVQQSSVYMDNFEADGKLDEWQHPLQAYNDDTKIQYSIANDDTYLYLAVASTRMQKILNGGIGLDVKLKDGKNALVTFPYNFTYDRRQNPEVARHPDRPWNIAAIKKIEVSGISSIGEKTIPIVNEFGIQAGIVEVIEDSTENKKIRYYTLELAIPLQYLGVEDVNELPVIDYSIILRGVILHPSSSLGGRPTGFALDSNTGKTIAIPQNEVNEMYEEMLDLHQRTFLKGKYQLAEK